MSNLLAFPDPRKAREDASLWLARLDRGLSDEERSGLRGWLKEPPNHKAFLEMGKLWRGLDVIAVLSELFPVSPEMLNPRPRRSFPSVALTAVAAVCIAAIGTLFLSGTPPWSLFDATRVAPPPVGNEIYQTVVGETREVKLADDTAVTLNTGTRIVVFYSPHVRDVYLSYGEATFEVTQDAARPFNVHAGKRVLQAMGTTFNIRVLSPDNVELTVTEGKVKVLYVQPARLPEDPARRRDEVMHPETTVNEMETALVEPGLQSVRRLEDGELAARLAWRHGMLLFQGEPLNEVLAEVGRYTNTKFVLADPTLSGMQIGGYYRAGDVEEFLSGLHKDFLIDSRWDSEGRVVLTAAHRHSR
jgi:transmembrane sensor